MNRRHTLFTLAITLALLFIIGIVAEENVKAASVSDAKQANATFTSLYLFRATLSPTPWYQSHTRVDASGGIHTAFYTEQSIYYAHCPAVCDNPANWTKTKIGDAGSANTAPDFASLALDASAHPRIMWNKDQYYMYAECNTNCANTDNWTSVQVPVAVQADSIIPESSHYFALDSQGRPRFVCYGYDYVGENAYTGFQYTTCDGKCTNASNWHSNLINLDETIEDLQIVLNANDQPRVMGLDFNSPEYRLIYLGCDTNCSQSKSWDGVLLYDIGFFGRFSFRLDKQGKPRVAYYNEDDGSNLYYAWSNSTVTTATDWLNYSQAFPANDQHTVDLAFDSQNRPRVAIGAYQNNVSSLGYAECTANCESTLPTWQYKDVETRDDLDLKDPIPLGGCTSQSWEVGEFPSLALDAADQPNISYYAQNTKLCLESDGKYHFIPDVWAIRFARPGGSTTTLHKVFLPLILRKQ